MMRRSDELEAATDWSALVGEATDDPPRPERLADALQRWANAFERDYGGVPLPPDFPPEVADFMRRICASDIAPDALEWGARFEARRGRRPRGSEVPKAIMALIPSKPEAGGRPRLDTQRWRRISDAWTAHQMREAYRMNLHMIQEARFLGAGGVLGLSAKDIAGDKPSILALQKTADEFGVSVRTLRERAGL